MFPGFRDFPAGGGLAPVTVAVPRAAIQRSMKSVVQFLPVITGKN